MVNNVSSVGSTTIMMRSNEMKGPPPPPKDKDTFLVGDTDGDGVLSASELAALTEGTENSTVSSMNVEAASLSYDVNKDGNLSGQELLERLNSNNGLSSLDMTMSKNDESAMMPLPSSSSEQVFAAYGKNNGNDHIAQRVELYENSDVGGGYIPIDVIS